MNQNNELICSFCNKTFTQRGRFDKHMCDKKHRWVDRGEKYGQIAYGCWLQWLNETYTNRSNDKKIYEEFSKSKLYKYFIQLGKHIIGTRMVNPQEFIPFVVRNDIKIDDWCKDSVYDKYTRMMVIKEDAMTVLERTIVLFERWADDTGNYWDEFFVKIPPGTAVQWIDVGRISPWILLLSVTGNKLLTERMSDEQFILVNKSIDIQRWRILMDRRPDDKRLIMEAIEEWKI